MNEIYIAIGGMITAGGGAFFGWLFGRRKQNADAHLTEIEGTSKILEMWKINFDELRQRLNNYGLESREREARMLERERDYLMKIKDLDTLVMDAEAKVKELHEWVCYKSPCNNRQLK